MTEPPPVPRGFVTGPERSFLAVAAAILVLGGAWLVLVGSTGVGAPCVWRSCTGLPCFSCGGTRTMLHLASGRWGEAWLTNPGALLAVLALGAGAIYALTAVAGWLPPWRPRRRTQRAVRWVVAAALAANWIYLLAAGRI